VLSLRLIPPSHASSPWTRPPRRRHWPRPRSSRTQREPSCPAARWHILHTAVASASRALQRLTANSQSRAHARDARERPQVDFQQLQTNPSRHTREAQYNSPNTQDSLRGRRPARCLPPPPVPLPTMSLHHDRGRPGHTHPIKVTLLLWVLPWHFGQYGANMCCSRGIAGWVHVLWTLPGLYLRPRSGGAETTER
jgi:hypothetical protein